MPRKWLETVHLWPALQPDTWYALRVAGIEKCADPPGLRVQLEFLHADQAGRTHAAALRMPIGPAGLTADYFRACGMDATPGRTVAPHDTVGRTIHAQFAQDVIGEQAELVHFGAPPDCAVTAQESAISTLDPESGKGR